MNSGELQFLRVNHPDGNDVAIAYRFQEGAPERPLFMWFPGFKSEMESEKATAVSNWAKSFGCGCLRFDYSGHGRSGGNFEDGTISKWLEEAATVLTSIRPSGPVYFAGSSMGAWIALLLAHRASLDERLKPSGLALIAPAWDMTRLMWDRAPTEARSALLSEGVYKRPSQYSEEPYLITRKLIDDGNRHLFNGGPIEFDKPVRIVHGREDADIPWEHSLKLMEILNCNDCHLTLIKDGEHRLSRPSDMAVLFSFLDAFRCA